MDADVKRVGYTSSHQRCVYLQQGRHILARGVRHNEECRERIYEALRQAGSEKIKRADLEDSAQNQTRARKMREPTPPRSSSSRCHGCSARFG